MAKKKRLADINLLAKNIVDIGTGEDTTNPKDKGKNTKMVELGRKGGLKGGKARASILTSSRRKEIAKKAAEKRWSSKK